MDDVPNLYPICCQALEPVTPPPQLTGQSPLDCAQCHSSTGEICAHLDHIYGMNTLIKNLLAHLTILPSARMCTGTRLSTLSSSLISPFSLALFMHLTHRISA
jgi:hypothetical protein